MAVRRFVSGALTALLAAGIVSSSAIAASAVSSDEPVFVSKINAARAARGLAALKVQADLTAIARAHSAEMAASDELYHSRGLATKVPGCWTLVGENVGVGPAVDPIHDKFMGSASHRANVLGAYNQVGVGVTTTAEGKVWVTEIFASRTCRATTAAPKTTPARHAPAAARPPQTAERRAPRAKAPAGPAPQNVDLLVRMIGLDANSVDPATGSVRGL